MRKTQLALLTLGATVLAGFVTITPAAARDYPWCAQGGEYDYPGDAPTVPMNNVRPACPGGCCFAIAILACSSIRRSRRSRIDVHGPPHRNRRTKSSLIP